MELLFEQKIILWYPALRNWEWALVVLWEIYDGRNEQFADWRWQNCPWTNLKLSMLRLPNH